MSAPEQKNTQALAVWNPNQQLLVVEEEVQEELPIWHPFRELLVIEEEVQHFSFFSHNVGVKVQERRVWTTFDFLILLVRFIFIMRDPEEEDPVERFRRETWEWDPDLERAIFDASVRRWGWFRVLLVRFMLLSLAAKCTKSRRDNAD